LNIIFIETFYGGSHKSFMDGLIKYSRDQFTSIILPSRFWKWRMRSAAIYIAENYGHALRTCDLIIATDLLNLAELKALAGFTCPAILFFHENQLTYPTPEGEKPEVDLGLANVVSALAADVCLFNSHYQLRKFNQALKQFINDIPEFVPERAHEQIMAKARVVYMGMDLSGFPDRRIVKNPVPVILWNHRWEFDKQPHVFFAAMYRLAEEGLDFRLIILGENFQMHPKEFIEARGRLGERIIQYGFVESIEDYAKFVLKADIIVSTAIQENFGYAVAEAIYCYTLPLLPNRLSYPEILPEKFHPQFLYQSEEDLHQKLKRLLAGYRQLDEVRQELVEVFAKFDWKNRVSEFDGLFEGVGLDRR
jgi:glycosyltransferase involved in cell wall biosynthesis